jgi:riboflavin kinase/FMN adenylyltransferase
MKIWRDISEFRAVNPVVTIGIFDGVHTGHHYLIEKLRRKADSVSGESVVITLWPHPRIVLNKDPEHLRYLTTIGEKTDLLKKSGIDHLIILPFTREFSELHSCEFVDLWLVQKIHLQHLIIGFNHKFGKDREGDFHSLKTCADQFGFGIEKLKPVEVGGVTVSSSLIRNLLVKGELERANQYLGYDYFLQGTVVDGNKLGRTIGFPTANIRPSDIHKLIPADGVYAVQVYHDGEMNRGMLNIGHRPTVTDHEIQKTIEVNLFGIDSNLYGEDVTVYFRSRMRDEKKFENIEQLRAQLEKDREMAIDILSHLK